jgi:ABC-type polysaccharide/polyol phosphate transport system ATPase subunit
MIAPDVSISVRNISKMFKLFKSPMDRLKQQIRRDRKYYEEFWAIHDISFELRRGESLGILGHNGAGKSTLLQILAGTLTPTSGQAYIRGRAGAIMTMGSGFKQDFTGRENVYVLGALMNFHKKEVDRQMDRIRDFADIGFFFDKPIRTYSSGMVARLAFAVYTCLEPDILIVDEVINVGDAGFKQKCLAHVSAQTANGMTLLLVSHNPMIVEQFCKSAIVLKKGEMIFQGDVKSSLKEYQKARS